VPSYNLAIVGFGNVGRALLRLLTAKEVELRRKYDIRWRLTGVLPGVSDGLRTPMVLIPLRC